MIDEHAVGASKLTIHHVEPNYKLPSPKEVEASNGPVIFDWGGVKIVRISDEVVAKFGFSVTQKEVETLQYLTRSRVTLPFPKLFAAYTCSPLQFNPHRPDALHTYIFMQYVPGDTLQDAWSHLDETAKKTVSRELGEYTKELRALPAPSYIGSVNSGPVLDNIVEQLETKGPFNSVADFHKTLAEGFARIHKGQVARYAQELLSAGKQHRITFAHADLRPANVLVHNGHVSGIVDWEMAGWYPEYWEFAKVFYVYNFHDDWGNHMLDVLCPYYPESAAHGYVTQHLW